MEKKGANLVLVSRLYWAQTSQEGCAGLGTDWKTQMKESGRMREGGGGGGGGGTDENTKAKMTKRGRWEQGERSWWGGDIKQLGWGQGPKSGFHLQMQQAEL